MVMPPHLLRLIVSCRKIAAEVTAPCSSTVVAMASSDEPEFLVQNYLWRNRFPRPRLPWDSRVASRVGEKLALRLRGIGVFAVEVDLGQEPSRLSHFRRSAVSLFGSFERAGVHVAGSEKLEYP
ncbi:hypothetical protein ZIOFF_017410 [Zingiber officinale]|uniref:Uncharacterized protein n=1 Tax=Zingiber officinale TaxID=94328 RepID=A0A8J5HBQ2_ZINOF|nr:hypothetical protein ZIOFF_017410 [Zingiber officinale]